MTNSTVIQWRAGIWHRSQFPDAEIGNVALKASEEVGELAQAVNEIIGKNPHFGGGTSDVLGEAADVAICLLVLVDRYTDGDLIEAVEEKLSKMERRTVYGHPPVTR